MHMVTSVMMHRYSCLVMLVSYIALALVLLGPAHALTFSFGSFSLRLSRSAAIFQRATLPGECLAPYAQIVDEDARYMVDNCLRKTMLPVPSWVAPQQSLEASLAVYEPSSRRRTSVVLLHGFDSSCLEWRKLAPILCRHGLHTYAIDVHGWGFGQLEGIADFSYRTPCDTSVCTRLCATAALRRRQSGAPKVVSAETHCRHKSCTRWRESRWHTRAVHGRAIP
jgi:hypothetical protein